MCAVSPVTTDGADTVSTGGVTCHSGLNSGWAVPPAFTSFMATKAVRSFSISTRVKVPAGVVTLPVTLNAVPLLARPTTSAPSPAASRRGMSSRATGAGPRGAAGDGPDGATLILILSVTDSPRIVSPTASSSWYSSPLKAGPTSYTNEKVLDSPGANSLAAGRPAGGGGPAGRGPGRGAAAGC